jgi:hypothetical protein
LKGLIWPNIENFDFLFLIQGSTASPKEEKKLNSECVLTWYYFGCVDVGLKKKRAQVPFPGLLPRKSNRSNQPCAVSSLLWVI